MGRHDLSYRSLFSIPRMVEELVREFVAEPWVEKLDFSTLKRVNASFVAPKLKGREGDLLWKLRLRDGSPVYEKSRGRKDLSRGTGRLVPLLSGADDAPLRQAVLVWIEQVLMPNRRRRKSIPEALGLEEFKDMLEKRVEEWNRELREEGRLLGLKEGIKEGQKRGIQKGLEKGLQKGLEKGLQKGEASLLLRLLERKFGRLDPQTRKRVRSADAERLLDWGERVLTAERLEDVFGN